jgi:hypothetical protein
VSLPATESFDYANWTDLTSDNPAWQLMIGETIYILSSQAKGSGAEWDVAIWGTDPFNANQYAQVAGSTWGDWAPCGVVVRASPGSGGSFYGFLSDAQMGAMLIKYANGTVTTLASTGTSLPANALMRLEAEGTTLRAYSNGTLMSWGAITDSSLSSGSAGIAFNGSANGALLDNWAGGNLSSGSVNASVALSAVGTFGQTKSAAVQVIRSASVVIQPIPVGGRPGLFAVSTAIHRLIPLAAVGAEAGLSSGLINTSENISVLLTKVGLSGQPGLLTASPSINSVVTLPAVGAIADSISGRANTFQSASIRLEALGSRSSLSPERVLASTNIQIALPSSLAAGYFSLPAALTTANADIKMAGLGVGALLAISNVSISRVVEIVPVGSIAAVGNAILSNAVNVAIPLVPVSAIAQNSPLSIEAVAYAMIELDQVGAIVHPSPLNVLAFQEGDPIFTLLFSLATGAMLISVEPKWQLSLRLTSNRLEL